MGGERGAHRVHHPVTLPILHRHGQMQKIDRELEVDDEEQLFLDRCDAGLFTLRQADITLVRLANMGNRQATEEISKLMDAKGVPMSEIVDTIEEYCAQLDD